MDSPVEGNPAAAGQVEDVYPARLDSVGAAEADGEAGEEEEEKKEDKVEERVAN